MSVGKFFKNAGKEIKSGSKSIGHVFEDAGHDIKKGWSQVYKDGKGAVSYSGKHLINDVDNISSALSSPILWIVAGGAIILIVANR